MLFTVSWIFDQLVSPKLVFMEFIKPQTSVGFFLLKTYVMEGMILPIVVGIVGLAIGFIIAKTLEKNKASLIIKNAKKQAASVLKEQN